MCFVPPHNLFQPKGNPTAVFMPPTPGLEFFSSIHNPIRVMPHSNGKGKADSGKFSFGELKMEGVSQ
jgi:hypothetical protein